MAPAAVGTGETNDGHGRGQAPGRMLMLARNAPPKHSDGRAISVVVGRFDPLVLNGLTAALHGDQRMRILATDLEGVALERTITHQAPQIAILNAVVAHSLLLRLKAQQPATGTVVLTHDPPNPYGRLLLALGATCIAQNASTADILDASHLTGHGGRVFIPTDGCRVEHTDPADAPLLTPREAEVLRHISEGMRYAAIALALGIEPETVRKYTVSIRQKLKVKYRQELIGLQVPRTSTRPIQ